MTTVIGFLIKPKIGIFDAIVNTYIGYFKTKSQYKYF